MGISHSELHSRFIIDGKKTQATLFQILEGACGRHCAQTEEFTTSVHDESVDPAPRSFTPEDGNISQYLSLLSRSDTSMGKVPLPYAESGTRALVAHAFLHTLFLKGHFRLEDLSLAMGIRLDREKVGSLAALYDAVSSACDYLDCLGVGLSSYSISCSEKGLSSLEESFRISLSKESGEEEVFYTDDLFNSGEIIPDDPTEEIRTRLVRKRLCPNKIVGDSEDWIFFIPFDTCSFRLGNSLLAAALGQSGGKAPDILDADYFMDCFEVVRELVEDGVVTSGRVVGRGGLALALEHFRKGGLSVDVGDIMRSYGNSGSEVLFGEVPGVLIEVRDGDYDYVDAELLLQDIAYYPIGHSRSGGDRLEISFGGDGVLSILRSLLESQTSEGED